MNDNSLISVIVPVYNTKNYLVNCIESLLSQSYPNYEIILVDDGSTDGSSEICKSFEQKDNRIIYLKKENGGLSSARNFGVEHSNGKYICFVDSDDFVSKDYLKFLHKAIIENDSDIAFCNFQKFYDDLHFEESEYKFSIKSKKELMEQLTCTGPKSNSIHIVVAWNKLIKKEIAEKITFPLKKWHEDEFYINRILENANKFVYVDANLYFYRQRNDSIVGSDNKSDIRHLDIIDAFEERISVYSRIADFSLYKKIICAYRNTIIIQYSNFKNLSVSKKIKQKFLKSFFKYKSISLEQLKGYILFIINPNLYYKIYW